MRTARLPNPVSGGAVIAALALAAVGRGGAPPAPGDITSGSTIGPPADTVSAPALIGHPRFRLLDAARSNVLLSGGPVSTVQTCGGGCHDVAYIERYNYHAQAGFVRERVAGDAAGAHPWDAGRGAHDRWDPLLYRAYADPDDGGSGTGVAEWIREFGWRHVGGGLAADSLGAELNCFLCHVPEPDNQARIRELSEGRFEWAATATLAATGIARRRSGAWRYDPSLFDDDGFVTADAVTIADPSSANCGLCHGLVHRGGDPVWPVPGLHNWATETRGQIFSAQHMSRSAMNLAGKKELNRPWDIHAERLMDCSNCHYLLNDPAFTAEAFVARPAHLDVDTRRQSIGTFLKRPLHQFVKGHSASGTVAPELNGSMRRCEGCHNVDATHDWLPYKKRHMERLLCESCHIPGVRSPARRVTDWTVMTPGGRPRLEYRGVDGPVDDPASLIEGFAPVILPRVTGDDRFARLAPHNVIASWYWVHGDPPRPVGSSELKRAYFDDSSYHPAVLSAFDENGDGNLGEDELVLDTDVKTGLIRRRLEALRLEKPRIAAEAQPFGIHHGVASGAWVTRSCDRCHSQSSVVTADVEIASVVPGDVLPVPVSDSSARMGGEFVVNADGRLSYRPATVQEDFYVLGHDRWPGVDAVGLLVIVAVAVGSAVHGGLRYRNFRSRKRNER